MRGVWVNSNCPTTKRAVEFNNHRRDKHKEVRDGIVGDGHRISEEDESRNNDDAKDANCGHKEMVLPSMGLS
ncbi:hypothetical protein U1Q18_032153 [Sarracenia purpurea var. burkii]